MATKAKSAESNLERRKGQIRRALLKRPLTLAQLADRIGKDTNRQALAGAIADMNDEVVKHVGRPTRYSKP